ncbi:MAG TPA: hypothetical protein VNL74_05260 [Methylococcus sp.]|nr:hypothetical protein [Methylococcus sp.]
MTAPIGKPWLSCSELAALRLPGMPTSIAGWIKLVEREGWPHREARGRGGKGGIKREYQPPPEVLRLIEAQKRSQAVAAAVSESATATLGMPETAREAVVVAEPPPQPQKSMKALGEIDPDLLFEIVMALESAYLSPDRIGAALSTLVKENLTPLRRIGEALESAKGLQDIDLSGLVTVLIEKWMVYAGVEAGAAARIYNRVRNIEDPGERHKVIEEEAAFFTQVKLLSSRR